MFNFKFGCALKVNYPMTLRVHLLLVNHNCTSSQENYCAMVYERVPDMLVVFLKKLLRQIEMYSQDEHVRREGKQ